MSGWLKQHGPDLYRSKGIAAVAGRDMKFVFQGVHDQVDFSPSESVWCEGEARSTTLVFIGRNINKAELQKELDATVLQPGETPPTWNDDGTMDAPESDPEDSDLAELQQFMNESVDLKTVQKFAADLDLPLTTRRGQEKDLSTLAKEVCDKLKEAEAGGHGHGHGHSHMHVHCK